MCIRDSTPTGFEEHVGDFRGPAVVIHHYLERPGT